MMPLDKTNANYATIDLLHHGRFMDVMLFHGWHVGMNFD